MDCIDARPADIAPSLTKGMRAGTCPLHAGRRAPALCQSVAQNSEADGYSLCRQYRLSRTMIRRSFWRAAMILGLTILAILMFVAVGAVRRN